MIRIIKTKRRHRTKSNLMNNRKKNIAIVMGGFSGEYDISVQSGKVVNKYLDRKKYNLYPIIMREEEWLYHSDSGDRFEIDKNNFTVIMSIGKVHFDGVFIAIHGTPGEDGKLQGYFDMLGISYTSCDHATSSLTFNKYFCKNFVTGLGVPNAKSVFLTNRSELSPVKILEELSLPVFVKPNNGGSSVGMSKVNKAGELEAALQKAFKEDEQILVEEFVKGREITCGIFRKENKLIILPVTEIISKKEFFDFESKYDSNLVEEVVPAQIPDEITKQCKDTSSFLYEKLNCKGVVRVDYIFNESGLNFLEVNTVPGMTEESIIPKMVEAYGMSLDELFSIITEEMFREE